MSASRQKGLNVYTDDWQINPFALKLTICMSCLMAVISVCKLNIYASKPILRMCYTPIEIVS